MYFFILLFLVGTIGLYFYVRIGLKHFKPIKPIELEILSSEQVSATATRIKFHVTFKIDHVFDSIRSKAGLRFSTIGTCETDKSIDHQILIAILKETEYGKYMELNMKHREIGEFNYEYFYSDTWLAVNFKTF